MANRAIQKMQSTGEKLYELRQLIAQKEEQNKKELETLKQERDAMQATLLADMNNNGLLSLKLKSGDSFFKGTRKGVDITNEALAFAWCMKNQAIKPDLIIAAQILKEMKQLPQGFALHETSFIGIRKNKKVEKDKLINQ